MQPRQAAAVRNGAPQLLAQRNHRSAANAILAGLNALNGDRCFDDFVARVVEIIAKRDVSSAMDHANCDEFGAGDEACADFLMATTKLFDGVPDVEKDEVCVGVHRSRSLPIATE